MTAKVILNPYANRWNAQKRWPEAEAALKAAGVDFELAVSPLPGGSVELAAEAARSGFSPIIAAGGDGTAGDVVHGLAQAAQNEKARLGPFGLMPMGTANDLAYKLGIPTDFQSAARIIAAGKSRRMDIGRVNDRYFANNSAIGIEPFVTTIQIKITWISGIPRYLIAALSAIAARPKWSGRIEWDKGSYQGPLSIVTVGNGSRSGGLFHMIPHADPFDGKLTFVYGFRATRREMLRTLFRIMKPGPGNYVEMEGIFEQDCSWLKIHLDDPSPAHTDGELFSFGIQDLEYRIFPERLHILLP